MRALFIAGTDTGVGKTVVTGLLSRFLLKKGYRVVTQKWVQSGCPSNLSSDIKSHLKIMGLDLKSVEEYLPHISPYVFKKACSPHLASKIDNKIIDSGKIKESFKLLSVRFDFVIVEGTGGVMVPFNKGVLAIDIVKELNLPVLIVVENKLGAINHSLLTIESLKKRKIKILGLVFNNKKEEAEYILNDNPRIVSFLTKEKILGILSKKSGYHELYKDFIPAAGEILKQLLNYG